MNSTGDNNSHGRELDLAGIGIGPANLSLAALLDPVPDVRAVFHERKSEFAWHPGLLLPGTLTQVHFLKDLVTLVDPTSRVSFLAFLVARKRLYRALIADRSRVSRHEFEEYYRWAASSLESLVFGSEVESLTWDGRAFAIETARRRDRARNVVVATGPVPYVPPAVEQVLGDEVFHAADYLVRRPSLALEGRTVALIGGGQTGAELFRHLLDERPRPRRIYWVTKRPNFLPLDESPFTNELFLPNYSRYFFSLPEELRFRLLPAQKLTSDGINGDLLTSIYRRLYDLECVEARRRFCHLVVAHELAEARRRDGRLELTFRNLDAEGVFSVTADVTILATGYRSDPPAVLAPLLDRIAFSGGRLAVRPDFSLAWDGPADRRIYVQNAARHLFGVAEPNLSLLAWRSATIINSVVGRRVYDLDDESAALDWRSIGGDEALEPVAAAAVGRAG